MSDPFLGQIIQVAFTFAPKDYAWCDGQLIPISQNPALASLLGAQFGGDMKKNFGLPDLRGRVPVHPGAGAVMSQGQRGGLESVTLTSGTMAAHVHEFNATVSEGTFMAAFPTQTKTLATSEYRSSRSPEDIYGQPTNMVSLTQTSGWAGGGLSHNNVQPSLVIGFAIAEAGTYPSRN